MSTNPDNRLNCPRTKETCAQDCPGVGRLRIERAEGTGILPLRPSERPGAVAGLHDRQVCLSGRVEPIDRGPVLWVAARMIRGEEDTVAALAVLGIGELAIVLDSADTPPRFSPATYFAAMPDVKPEI